MGESKQRARGPQSHHVAAALAFFSQAIHLWLLPGQFVAAMVPAVFFLFVAVGQGLLGASLLVGPGRWAIRLGILFNLFVVSIWTITRFFEIPLLFEPLRLPVGGLGVAATVAEVALIALLFGLGGSVLRKGRERRVS